MISHSKEVLILYGCVYKELRIELSTAHSPPLFNIMNSRDHHSLFSTFLQEYREYARGKG